MSQIAIITLHSPHNFGAMLQAYALQTAIASLGHNAEILDYGSHPQAPEIFNRSDLKALPHAFLCFVHRKARYKRFERFAAFADQHMKLTRHYTDRNSLREHPPQHDVLVCGSDQIWNPTHHDFQPEFFLHFGQDTARRIAYAPSFGVAEIPGDKQQPLARVTRSIGHLSCRETSGVKVLENITGRHVTHVCDPTLLLTAETWLSIAKAPQDLPGKYILVYALENSPALREAVAKITITLSLPVVCIQVNVRNPDFPCTRVIRDAGPREFLGLVANASYIITNSFHGCVFSILFQKQFFSPLHGKLNERMRDFFSFTGLTDCQDLAVTLKSLPRQIDYEAVHSILNGLITNSKEYLKNAIEDDAKAA
ncbi:MAG: polysaccharide pyruvyl transferase family protein [Armatimonadetes bacterium]|nr:polysaccharide pyruvyl transferase family protein [Akkermansiaceae bacterium]